MRLRVNADFDAVGVAEIFLSLVGVGSIPERGLRARGLRDPADCRAAKVAQSAQR